MPPDTHPSDYVDYLRTLPIGNVPPRAVEIVATAWRDQFDARLTELLASKEKGPYYEPENDDEQRS